MMPDPVARRRAGGARLRAPRLGVVALHRLLGRPQMRQGHDRGHRGCRRRPAPAQDRDPPTSSCPRAASTSAAATPRWRRRRGSTTTSASPPKPLRARTELTAASGATPGPRSASFLRASPGSTPTHALDSPRHRRGRVPAARHHHLQGRHGLAARHGELPRVGRTTSSTSSSSRKSASSIEVQIKEAIFDDRRGRRVTGWKNESGEDLLGQAGARPGQDRPHPGTLLAVDGVEIRRAQGRAAPS